MVTVEYVNLATVCSLVYLVYESLILKLPKQYEVEICIEI